MLYKIQKAFKDKCVIWRQHALARMMERGITRHDVFNAVQNGKAIEHYPEIEPYPGCLIAGESCRKTIHVVASRDKDALAAYVITVYIPDATHFEENGETRKKRIEK